jgi:phosphatidylglycerophosphatase A
MPARSAFLELLRHPPHFLAFGGGAGLSPKAPGTAGSLVAVPLYIALAPLPPLIYLLLVLALAGLGVWACARTERDLGVHDHPGIVWDEIVGMLVALFHAPVSWVWLLLGFALFRLFDIWKPFPIRWLNDNVKGGWGIMLDDLAAGIVAAACLQGLIRIYGH